MKKKIDIGFCFANREDGKWSIMIDESQLSAASMRDIERQLEAAFQSGMSFKAQQLRECLEVKEHIKLL